MYFHMMKTDIWDIFLIDITPVKPIIQNLAIFQFQFEILFYKYGYFPFLYYVCLVKKIELCSDIQQIYILFRNQYNNCEKLIFKCKKILIEHNQVP